MAVARSRVCTKEWDQGLPPHRAPGRSRGAIPRIGPRGLTGCTAQRGAQAVGIPLSSRIEETVDVNSASQRAANPSRRCCTARYISLP
jgi:hypothetical protein